MPLQLSDQRFLDRARRSWRQKVIVGWAGVVSSVALWGVLEYQLAGAVRYVRERVIHGNAALQALSPDSPIAHQLHVKLLAMASLSRTLIEVGLIGSGHLVAILLAGLMMNIGIAMIFAGRRDQRYLAILDATTPHPTA